MTGPPPADWLDAHGLDAWRLMRLVREVEERLPGHVGAGHVPGSTHPAAGMEAIAAGVSLHLGPRDTIASTHRGHAHVLARGADPGRLLAEIFGRVDGYCRGRGGSMHLACRDLGILGTNGIVGASIGLATGAALTAHLTGSGGVAVAYFGDGATNQGIFHESLNLAAIWRLPCVYVCENNHFAQSSRVEEMVNVADLSVRAAASGIPGEAVDGMDVHAVWEAAGRAIGRARAGLGPTLIVADTYRFLGHMVGDTEVYRTREEVAVWTARDPIERLEGALASAGVLDAEVLERELAALRARVDEAERFALASPQPAPDTALEGVRG